MNNPGRITKQPIIVVVKCQIYTTQGNEISRRYPNLAGNTSKIP